MCGHFSTGIADCGLRIADISQRATEPQSKSTEDGLYLSVLFSVALWLCGDALPQSAIHKSLRSGHDALLEDQRAAAIGPHLAGRRASDFFRLAPTHFHLLLGHSRVDLSFLNRRPHVCSPFV